MRVYLAGGISGNLRPAWARLAEGDISSERWVEVLKREGF